jgi:hypothetical protein
MQHTQEEEEEEQQQQQQRPPCTHTRTHSSVTCFSMHRKLNRESDVLIPDWSNTGSFYIPYKATRGSFTHVIVLHYNNYVQEKMLTRKTEDPRQGSLEVLVIINIRRDPSDPLPGAAASVRRAQL